MEKGRRSVQTWHVGDDALRVWRDGRLVAEIDQSHFEELAFQMLKARRNQRAQNLHLKDE